MSRSRPEPVSTAVTRSWRVRIAATWRTLVSVARLACGIPDYDTYVAHLRRAHPDRSIPSYEAFFAERQRARYGSGRSRCC
jgi:uncharacterized short protein YbdD (DUF466 family)